MKKVIFTMTMCLSTAMLVQSQELVLPKGMEKLTPDGLETSSFNGFVNPMSPKQETVKTGNIYFAGKNAESGNELWVSGKTKATTKMVKDIFPGAGSSDPSSLVMMGGKLYFAAATEEHGKELWVSDGTPEGTKMVIDIYPGKTSSNPGSTVVLGNKILFQAMDEESELTPVVDPTKPEKWLWVSDGTAAGTFRISNVPINSYMEVVGDKAFFAGVDLDNYDALWVTDGTKAGTKLVKNINNKPTTGTFKTGPAAIGALRNVNDKWVVFRAETVKEQVGGDKDYGSEIWYSDGTPEGTKWIGYDFAKGESAGKPLATEFAEPYAVGDVLYFRANDGIHGVEPCVWDLSKPIVEGSNPRQIFDVNHWAGNQSYASWPSAYIEYQGHLLMQVNGGYFMPGNTTEYASGYSLWLAPINKLDTCIYQRQFWGTEIAAGSLQDGCSRFTKVKDKLFFTAQDNNNNSELWVIDGIGKSPEKIVDFPDNGSVNTLMNVDDNLYFSSSTQKALFKFDLSASGLGINKIDADGIPVTVYVDPHSKQLEVKTETDIISVQLFNLSGQSVLSAKNQSSINVSGLNGFYIVKIQLKGQAHAFSTKIIIR